MRNTDRCFSARLSVVILSFTALAASGCGGARPGTVITPASAQAGSASGSGGLNAKTGPPAAAEGEDLALGRRVDEYLAPFVERHLLSGAVAVMKGDRVLVARTDGALDERGTPFTLGTRSRIASITKTFTAAAIEILAKRRRLAVSDPLARFLPGFPNAEHIVVEQLLLHQAGLADPDYDRFFDRQVSLDELVSNIGSKAPLFPPGSQSRYSNAGYVVLAKVIEVASGSSYRDFLQREIFAPLGLADTLVDGGDRVIDHRATGFLPGLPPAYAVPAPAERPEMYAGSGIVLSSATDLLAWARAVAAAQLVDLGALHYPYGWGRRNYLGDQVIEQSGELAGCISYLAHYRDRDLTVVVLSNLEVGPNDRIGKALGQLAGGAAVAPPSFPAPKAGFPLPTAAGLFAGEAGELILEPRDGTETTRWKGDRTTDVAWPIDPGQFFIPRDGSILRILDAETVERTWGDGPAVTFKRQSRP